MLLATSTFGIRDQSLKTGLKEFFRKCGKEGEALISKASMRQSGRRLTYQHAGARKCCVITRMLIAPKTGILVQLFPHPVGRARIYSLDLGQQR